MVSAIRRYSSPTCTLELLARTSPLSRWTQRPVWREATFRLSFDGPHRPNEARLSVQGNHDQLEALAEAVRSYVQQMLTRTVQQFSYQLQPAIAGSATDSTSPTLTAEQDIDSQRPEWSAPAPVARLKPLQQLGHQLQITLDGHPARIEVSTTELLDLADALETYEREGAIAISAPPTQSPWLRNAAAAVLVVGVTTGLGTAALQMARQSDDVNVAQESAGGIAGVAGQQTRSSIPRTPARLDANDTAANLPEITSSDRLPPPRPAPPPSASSPPQAAPSSTAPGSVPQPTPPAPSGPNPAAGPAAPNSAETGPESIPPELSAIPPIESALGEADSGAGSSGEANLDETRLSGPLRTEDVPSQATRARGSSDSATAPTAPRAPASVRPSETARRVQEAVQSRWQPPDGLRRSLEYRVTVGADGRLQRVVPIGDTASIYLPNIAALQVGEPVSAPAESPSPPIRLLLRRDGQVRAFLE